LFKLQDFTDCSNLKYEPWNISERWTMGPHLLSLKVRIWFLLVIYLPPDYSRFKVFICASKSPGIIVWKVLYKENYSHFTGKTGNQSSLSSTVIKHTTIRKGLFKENYSCFTSSKMLVLSSPVQWLADTLLHL